MEITQEFLIENDFAFDSTDQFDNGYWIKWYWNKNTEIELFMDVFHSGKQTVEVEIGTVKLNIQTQEQLQQFLKMVKHE